MNDEIKEILDNIKRQNEWEGIEYFKTPLSTEQANKLLDYITNLQEENEKLKDRDLIIAAELTKLQDENKQLKDNWNKLKEWLEEMINEIKTNDIYDRTEYECTQITTLENVLAKLEEIGRWNK